MGRKYHNSHSSRRMKIDKKYLVAWWCSKCDCIWRDGFLPEIHHDLTGHTIYRSIISEVQYDKSVCRSDEVRKDATLCKRNGAVS